MVLEPQPSSDPGPTRHFEAELLDRVEAAVLVFDRNGTLIHTNREGANLFDLPPDEALGRDIAELVAQPTAGRLREALAETLRDGSWEGEIPIVHAGGKETPTHTKLTALADATGSITGAVSVSVDITERKRGEERLAFLSEASRKLTASLEFEEALKQIADLTVPRFADYCGLVLSSDDQLLPPLTIERGDHEVARLLEETRSVLQSGQAWFSPENKAREGLTWAIAVPIAARGRTFGVLTFALTDLGRRYERSDLAVAEDLGHRIGSVVENTRVYRERDQIARTLQQSLLPARLPLIAGLDFAARYLPSGESVDVGGDFYDLFPLSRFAWAFDIGDVCGKGPDAAVVTALARHTMRAVAPEHKRPSQVLHALNDVLLRESPDRFVTAIFGRFQFTRKGLKVLLSCGGHPLPFLVRRDGTVEPVGQGGALLGVLPDPELHDTTAEILPGDALVLFTDGLLDERSGGVDEAEIASVLSSCGNCEAGEIADLLIETVESRGVTLRDDVALLVIQLIR
ncbi:MAG: SpoIIE family protein phosphatase [Actinomycetota bacterium]